MEKITIAELIEMNREINQGITLFKQELDENGVPIKEEVQPLIISDLKIKAKGYLGLVTQKIKPFVDEHKKAEDSVIVEYGVQNEDGTYTISEEKKIEFYEKIASLLNEEVELDFSEVKLTYEDLNIQTKLPLVSFCKYLIKN